MLLPREDNIILTVEYFEWQQEKYTKIAKDISLIAVFAEIFQAIGAEYTNQVFAQRKSNQEVIEIKRPTWKQRRTKRKVRAKD